MDERESSPAFKALGKAARKVLGVIEDQIAASGGDTTTLTHADLMFDHHCGAPSPNLRLLRYLGLIEVVSGKSQATTTKLSQEWRRLEQHEVDRLTAAAREVRVRGQEHLVAR